MGTFLGFSVATILLMAGSFTVGALMGRPFFRMFPFVRDLFPKTAD